MRRMTTWFVALAGVVLVAPNLGLAQEAGEIATAWAILEEDLFVLFRILVVATVVERVLEVLGLVWPYLGRACSWLINKFRSRPTGAPRTVAPEVLKIRKQLSLHAIGVVLGVVICLRADLGIFAQLQGIVQGGPGEAVVGWLVSRAGTSLDYVVTGVLVGLGTEPIHSIIQFILRRREARRTRLATAP